MQIWYLSDIFVVSHISTIVEILKRNPMNDRYVLKEYFNFVLPSCMQKYQSDILESLTGIVKRGRMFNECISLCELPVEHFRITLSCIASSLTRSDSREQEQSFHCPLEKRIMPNSWVA